LALRPVPYNSLKRKRVVKYIDDSLCWPARTRTLNKSTKNFCVTITPQANPEMWVQNYVLISLDASRISKKLSLLHKLIENQTDQTPAVKASGAIFFTNPCKTLPGPHSVNRLAPSFTMFCTDCVHLTGAVS
jgi:hypothetical protein